LFYFCIVSDELDLFKAACFIVGVIITMVYWAHLYKIVVNAAQKFETKMFFAAVVVGF
jgi:hypothetical protein